MPPINLLYINSVAQTGGAEASLIELAAHLNREEFHLRLVTTAEGPLEAKFREIGCQVDHIQFPYFSRRRPLTYWGEIYKLVSLIRGERIDLIHVNCDRAVPHAVLAAKLTGRKVLCHIHDMTRAWFLPRYVHWLNRSDRIIANSKATAEHCRIAGMDQGKLQVIYECFEFKRYKQASQKDREAIRHQWGVNDQTIAIGLVGQIIRHKGHKDLLKAAARISSLSKDLKFIIIGDDSLSEDRDFLPELKRFIEEQSLNNSVNFVGHIRDIPRAMSGLDIAVVPSWEEPFGRVVVEAMASALPVVATQAGGIPEIVSNGESGILIPPQDVDALTDALLMLSQNPDLRRKMGDRGRSVAERFDINPHTRLFEQTYKSILEGQSAELPYLPFGDPWE